MRLTALGAPWMSTRTHILREYRASEEWIEAARANRIGLVRVACWRSPHAVSGRPFLCIAAALWLALSVLTLVTMSAWQGWAILAALLDGLAA